MKLSKLITTPDELFEAIPVDIVQNVKFRQELHDKLAQDKKAQEVFLQLCYIKPQIAFNCCLWTFNPRQQAGCRSLPFILRPHQVTVVDELKRAIDEGHDLLIEKSREEGATELIAKMFVLYFVLVPETLFLCGSRKEEYVDASTQISGDRVTGSPRCIFHKILYGLARLPAWMRPALSKSHMHLENVDNYSVIDGEATNENFGAGDRRTAVLLDEFGRVEHKLAQNIADSINDVTDCVIYNSTHWYGRAHPFYKIRRSGRVKVITMPWWKNPEKNVGLYRSPDLNKIEILDLDYYRKNFPGCFDHLKEGEIFELSKLEVDLFSKGKLPDVVFIADGSDKYRSLWYDREEKRRSPRDMAQNVDMNAIGAGAMFFDEAVLQRIREERVRKPDYTGEIKFKYDKNGKIAAPMFVKNAPPNRFKWWGKLIQGRPDQSHNYVVAADISLGTGASNSVAGVYDVNTSEKVGVFATPNLPPEEFCDYCIALCYWVGGRTRRPYLIWEANGPGGSFDKRRRFHGYNFFYVNTKERLRNRKKTRQPGWYSTRTSKYDLLLELRIALAAGFREIEMPKKLIIYDEDSLKEYEDYTFAENGDIGLAAFKDDETGARTSHGDRVIADGLAVLAMSDQHKAAIRLLSKDYSTLAYRRFLAEKEKEKERENSPWL